MQIDLSHQVVLITGATGGIGQAAVRSLAEAGATLAIHFNREPELAHRLAEEVGHGSKPFAADLADPKNCPKLFRDVIGAFNRIDVLVNNAGTFFHSPIEKDIDEWLADWDRTMAVNLTSTAVLCRESITHFRGRGGGRIIHIASRAAFRGDDKEYLAYAASKGGMVALSRSIARAYGKDNIKSFVIAPGFVRTRMADDYFKEHGEAGVLSQIALPRLTEPADVAPTILFLASGLMDHATGCTIDINAASYVR